MLWGIAVVVGIVLVVVGGGVARLRANRRIDTTPPDLRRAGDAPTPLPKSSSWMGPLN